MAAMFRRVVEELREALTGDNKVGAGMSPAPKKSVLPSTQPGNASLTARQGQVAVNSKPSQSAARKAGTPNAVSSDDKGAKYSMQSGKPGTDPAAMAQQTAAKAAQDRQSPDRRNQGNTLPGQIGTPAREPSTSATQRSQQAAPGSPLQQTHRPSPTSSAAKSGTPPTPGKKWQAGTFPVKRP